MERSKKSAFSLAELMITLLILSIVLSAVMPAVNKRNAGQENVWRWVYQGSHAYFGTGGKQSVLVGMSVKPVKNGGIDGITGEPTSYYTISDYRVRDRYDADHDNVGEAGEETEHTLSGIGDRLMINKTTIDERHPITNSHISLFTQTGDETNYTGRISMDPTNIAIGKYTMAHVKYEHYVHSDEEIDRTHAPMVTKNNTAVGQYALFGLSEGYRNIAIGNEALYKNSDGYANTAVGFQASTENTDGYENTVLGYMALKNSTAGSFNTAIGSHALRTAHKENNATALNIDGLANTAVGFQSLLNGGLVSFNTAIGYRSGASLGMHNYSETGNNQSNTKNILIGDYAGENLGSKSISTANLPVNNYNVFIGSNSGKLAGYDNTNKEINLNNTFIGAFSGYSASSASSPYSGSSPVSGKTNKNNTVIGASAGRDMGHNDSGSTTLATEDNVLVGYKAGHTLAGDHNTMLGSNSGGYYVMLGSAPEKNSFSHLNKARYSTFVGTESGYYNNDSLSNVLIGARAGYRNTTGNRNLIAGFNAVGWTTYPNAPTGSDSFSTGDDNVILGVASGFKNTSGSTNTYVGAYSGFNTTTGSGNVFIGNKAGYSNTTGSNLFAIANDENRDLMKGTFSTNDENSDANLKILTSTTDIGPVEDSPVLRITGGDDAVVGIGGTIVAAGGHSRLEFGSSVNVNGELTVGGTPVMTVTSDKRLKNIKGDAEKGLSAIDAFKIIRYTYKNDENKREHVGIIAQDLQKIMPNAVVKRNDGFFGISLDDITFTIAKAVQELHQAVLNIAKEVKDLAVKVISNTQRIEALEKENKALKQQINDLDARLKKLEETK